MAEINTLVPVTQETIGNATVNTVDGRKLHSYLEVAKDYTDWMKAQIKRAKLIENSDFVKLPQKGENSRTGQTRHEYHLTLEAGKHVAMISGTAKGREVRDYFIECEKKAKEPVLPAIKNPQTAALMYALAKQDELEQEQLRQSVEIETMKLAIAKVEATTQPENEYFTVAGFARLNGLSVDLNSASGLGKRCSTLSKREGKMVGKTNDPRWGFVNTYHVSVLQAILNH